MLRLRAAALGTYRRTRADSSTRREVSSRTEPVPLKTRETVATETPAWAATCLIVALAGVRSEGGILEGILLRMAV